MVKKRHNPARRRLGLRREVSCAIFGNWLRAKVVLGQRRQAPDANVAQELITPGSLFIQRAANPAKNAPKITGAGGTGGQAAQDESVSSRGDLTANPPLCNTWV